MDVTQLSCLAICLKKKKKKKKVRSSSPFKSETTPTRSALYVDQVITTAERKLVRKKNLSPR